MINRQTNNTTDRKINTPTVITVIVIAAKKLKTEKQFFDGSNKGMPSIIYSRAWNTLLQA